MNTPESKSAAYAESKIPNANAHDAPFCTTGDRWEEIKEAFLAGYTADRWIPVTTETMPEEGTLILPVDFNYSIDFAEVVKYGKQEWPFWGAFTHYMIIKPPTK